MRFCSAIFVAASLLLPVAARAQFGGEGKPTNDTDTIHTTCTKDGIQSVHDDYSNTTYTDRTVPLKYILPIEGARARGEWNEVLRLSNMSIRVAPKCYYPYFSKAQAEMYQCHLPEAKATLEEFVRDVTGRQDFTALSTVAKNMLDSINSGDAASKCQ